MRRWLVAVCVAAAGLFTPHKMSAQFAVVDAGNLAQAVLSFLQDGDNMVNNTYTNKAFMLATFATHFGAKQAPIGCESLIYRGATLEGFTMGRARLYTAIMLAIPAALAVVGTVIIIKRKNRL